MLKAQVIPLNEKTESVPMANVTRLLTAVKILNGNSALVASIWFLSVRVSDNNLGKIILVVTMMV